MEELKATRKCLRRFRLPTLAECEGRTLYERVGAKRTASSDRLTSAYRARAKRYHPSCAGQTPEANARFRFLQEAYDELMDPCRRAAYDARLGAEHVGGDALANESANEHTMASVEHDPLVAPWIAAGGWTWAPAPPRPEAIAERLAKSLVTKGLGFALLDAAMELVAVMALSRRHDGCS